ncbi:MAG: hypothetical protein LBB84_08120, partial [Tannerellaceae bacterium]|nr:hypothetical protein [Tannerellaceae bacterium]
MKIRIRRIGYIALLPLMAAGLLCILLYMPLSGDWIGKRAIRYMGKTFNVDIEVEHIKLSFPLTLSLHHLTARLPENGDTLCTLQHLNMRIIPGPLLGKILSVGELSLQNLRLSTGHFIEGMELTGSLDTLSAQAMIRLASERVTVQTLSLSDASIRLRIDSMAQEDTDSIPIKWKIDIVDCIVNRIRFAMQMPADTLSLVAGIGNGQLRKAGVDLGNSRYTIGQLRLSDTNILYDGNERPPDAGLDYNHIYLSDIHASIDSVAYQGRSLNVRIQDFAASERSGLEVSSLDGSIGSDSLQIYVPGLRLQTPASSAVLQAVVPWSILDNYAEGTMRLILNASIGKKDLLLWDKGLPPDFRRTYPDMPLSLNTEVEGNLSSLHLRQLTAELPDAFSLSVSGQASNIIDSLHRSTQIRIEAQVRKLHFALNLLPASQRESFRIPEGLTLSGDVGLNENEWNTHLLLSEDTSGTVELKARYHTILENYEATLSLDSLLPVRFMPNDSLMRLTAFLHAEGKGMDLFADSTRSALKGHISDMRYASTEIKDIQIDASLDTHHAQFGLKSLHPFANMDISFDGSLHPQSLKGMWIGSIDSLDLQRLHLTDMPFATSFQLFAEMESDFRINHLADLTLGNWELNLADRHIKPKMLTFHARTDKDTTRLSVHVGDFGVILTGNSDVETMQNRLQRIAEDISRQLKKDSSLHIAALTPLLPDMNLVIHAEKDNPVYNILRQYGIDMDAFRLDASASPQSGLRMDAALYTLYRDTFRIDTIRASVRPDSAGLNYHAEVVKNK